MTGGNLFGVLERVGELHWAPRARAASSATAVDLYEVLSWYGGMGSLNDLIVGRANGHTVEASQAELLNQRIHALRSRIYELAAALTPSG